jgi:hypothetical protein
MKISRIRAFIWVVILMFVSVTSCNVFDLDVNVDPNNPSQASLELLLTNVQLNASSTFAGGLNTATSGFLGQTDSFDRFNMLNGDWNGTWNFLYYNPLNDLERLVVSATEQGNVPHTLGVAQVMKAYYFSLMVDLWGAVPYFEAFKGDQGNKNPVYTSGSDIYADLIKLCDAAVANFNTTSTARVKGDVIYDNGALSTSQATQIARWRRAAKSLKLRLLLQTRGVGGAAVTTEIQKLVTEGDLILSGADDFQFKFGRLQNPDDRHPWYISGYSGGEAGFNYFGHQLMFEMLKNKDPRTPFYFKRQTATPLNPQDPTDKQTIPCSQRDDCFYGYFVANPTITQALFGKAPAALDATQTAYLAGFFGRDRSDPSGVPNDNPIRTTVGAYPAAGLFDDVAELGGGNKGTGDGIFPMITSWMVKFYILEAKLSLGVSNSFASESELLKSALTDQVNKVFAVGVAADGSATSNVSNWPTLYKWPITYKTQTAFVDDVAASYPVAGGTSTKLNYVLKQAWFANFGNGFEIYNAFRRTGFPNDLQTPLQRQRQFALRLPYAQDELNLNQNTPAVVFDSPSNAVFWDVLKFQF